MSEQMQISLNGQKWVAQVNSEEDKAHWKEFEQEMAQLLRERVEAVIPAIAALERLGKVMTERSGQPYKVRALLYSLWNGKPASLVEIVCLDWAIRKDLLAVMLAFGADEFFYKEIQESITKAGQWEWFLEERLNREPLEEWLKGGLL